MKSWIPVYKPYINDKTTKFVHDAIKSGWISSHGRYLDLASNELLHISGSKRCILTNCGTAANHLMAIGLRYKYPQIKNLIVPNNVYVAAWNQFLVEPKFNLIPIDCDMYTWNIYHYQLEKTLQKYSPENTAILIVHNIGNVVNVLKIRAKYPDYVILEDNCEGFLGEYEGQKTGTASLMSSVSFYGNKTITSGEGGALLTDDPELFEYLYSVHGQGYTAKKFIFDKMGYNYRMTNVQAALLYGQLMVLPEIMARKEHISSFYKEQLSCGYFQKSEIGTKHSNWMFGVNLVKPVSELREELFELGIETRPMFYPMSRHKHLKEFAREEGIANILSQTCLILPSSPSLTDDEIVYITDSIKGLMCVVI